MIVPSTMTEQDWHSPSSGGGYFRREPDNKERARKTSDYQKEELTSFCVAKGNWSQF